MQPMHRLQKRQIVHN